MTCVIMTVGINDKTNMPDVVSVSGMVRLLSRVVAFDSLIIHGVEHGKRYTSEIAV